MHVRAGDLVLSIEAFDNGSVPFEEGYAPVTTTISAWLTFIDSQGIVDLRDFAGTRFLLALGRRLDASHHLFRLVRERLAYLDNPRARGAKRIGLVHYETIGLVEVLVISLNRELDMAAQLQGKFDLKRECPSEVRQRLEDIVQIRNAYEHIEDRAFE